MIAVNENKKEAKEMPGQAGHDNLGDLVPAPSKIFQSYSYYIITYGLY